MARDPTIVIPGRLVRPDPASAAAVPDREPGPRGGAVRGAGRATGGAAGRPRLRVVLAALAGLLLVACSGALLWIASLGPAPVGEGLAFSTEVLDRNGTLLRAYATAEGRWRLPVRPENVDPRFFDLLFAYEDKRFPSHRGVDPAALARAAGQFTSHGRIVSGASTLTMQVARLLEPRAERSLPAKLRQIVRALQLEQRLSKDDILKLYLSLAPYGGNIEGVRAASLVYFGHEPRRLTLGEAALLVALPQSPEARRPDRFPAAAQAARDRVLDRAVEAGVVEPADAVRAKAEPVPRARRPMSKRAPHAADRAVAEAPARPTHRLTIDAGWQARLEELARDRARSIGPGVSVAILAVDHATGEVLARVGSADYFDERRAGQVDMTTAVRSPGSTLKPFIYGLGFEDGFIHPETFVDDRPMRYGAYAPENFDLSYQGTVSARRALQLSLNVPAVLVLDKVGASRFSARLAQAGARLVLPAGETPGLAIGLGGTGVTLADLVRLYAGLARLGTTLALTETLTGSAALQPARLMEPVAAWQVGNVLLGAPPPDNAAGGRIAFKTGTSYGYRDAWAIGFDGEHTIGVWVGRPDGAPVPGILGRTTAAPVLFDAFARLGTPVAPLPPAPRGVVFAANGKLPAPLRRFRPNGVPAEDAAPPLRILFPPNGAQLDLPGGSEASAPIALKISGGRLPITVLVNGMPRAILRDRQTASVAPDGVGFTRLTILDATGATDSVLVRLQ
ncbi:MAG: penicillin-binding protein 1C [Xanthobacteraceae bacterium]